LRDHGFASPEGKAAFARSYAAEGVLYAVCTARVAGQVELWLDSMPTAKVLKIVGDAVQAEAAAKLASEWAKATGQNHGER
jgi:hypothetical protein